MIIRIKNLKIYVPYSSPLYTVIEIFRILIPAIIMGGGFLAILWLLG